MVPQLLNVMAMGMILACVGMGMAMSLVAGQAPDTFYGKLRRSILTVRHHSIRRRDDNNSTRRPCSGRSVTVCNPARHTVRRSFTDQLLHTGIPGEAAGELGKLSINLPSDHSLRMAGFVYLSPDTITRISHRFARPDALPVRLRPVIQYPHGFMALLIGERIGFTAILR